MDKDTEEKLKSMDKVIIDTSSMTEEQLDNLIKETKKLMEKENNYFVAMEEEDS